MPSSPGDPDTVLHLGAIVFGLVMASVFVVAWRGTWRSWAGDVYGSAPLSASFSLGCFSIVYGIDSLAPGLLGSKVPGLVLLAVVVVISIGIWDPPWFGPAWYRRFKRRGDRSTTGAGALTARPTPRQHSENQARQARRPRTPRIRRHVSLIDPDLGKPTGLHTEGLATGHLLYYDDELVFAADAADDAARPGPTIRTIPADTIFTVRTVPTARTKLVQIRFRSVQIVTTDGTEWYFECIRARRAADDIRRLYVRANR